MEQRCRVGIGAQTLLQAVDTRMVEPGRLVFFESRAIPSPGIQTSPTSASGNFAFTGEGQEWTKYETLQLQGATLVRTERDPNASFSYVRC